MLFIAQQIFSPSQIPSFAQRNFCHFKNNAPKVHAAFKSPIIVLEENKHFTEDARVSPPKQTELFLLSRLSIQWSFLSTNMGVMFFLISTFQQCQLPQSAGHESVKTVQTNSTIFSAQQCNHNQKIKVNRCVRKNLVRLKLLSRFLKSKQVIKLRLNFAYFGI